MNAASLRRVAARVATLVVLAVLPTAARAQDDEVSKQLWLDFNPRWVWPSGVALYGDVGIRTELGAQGWGRFVVRPGVLGPVGQFQLSGGLGSFYTANEDSPDRWELRPFQGIAAVWPRSPLRLDHYLRFEERFEFETADWTLDASLRIRYRLQVPIQWSGVTGEAYWRLLLHAEGFLTVTGDAGQFDEHVRIGAGVERGFGLDWRVRVDVTWQKVGAPFSGAPTDDLYIRVRAYRTWP